MDGALVNYKSKYEASQQTIKDRYAIFEVPYLGIDNDDYVNGQGFCCDDTPQGNATKSAMQNDNPELFQYYYHSDHLGSTSLITNLDGEVVQHVEYVPFGEVFIEERNNTWNTPYLFNAKELDEETGLYYYGARYYEARTSLWLSADPMQEKYPNVSTYTYCSNNPIKYSDPRGLEIEENSLKEWNRQKAFVEKQRDRLQSKIDRLTAKAESKGWSNEKLANKIGDVSNRVGSLDVSLSTMATMESSSQIYSLSKIAGSIGGVTLNTSNNVINISFNSTANFVHEIKHVEQFESKWGHIAFDKNTGNTVGQDVYDEVQAYKAQYAYSPSSVKGLPSTSTINSMQDILPAWVQGLDGGDLYVPGGRANTGISPIYLNSTKTDFIRAYPNNSDIESMPDDFSLKNSNIYYKR